MNKMPRIVCFMLGLWVALPAGAELILVENGESRAPIVIFADAPPLTRQAADELALYIEKTSGARPEVLEGRPEPLPDSAIWVGLQPVLTELFPDQDFDFQHPEEILIAANEKHLVIAGRDRWDPESLSVDLGRGTREGIQQEYGTHNAVYTFLQDYLGVRWLWPGELGEDVLSRETIAFEPFEYRYHPQVRARGGLLPWAMVHGGIAGPDHRGYFAGGASSQYWLRAQRLQLSEWPSPGGHGFPGGFGPGFNWFERFYERNPEYFALQPDGTRGGGDNPFPNARNIKMCHSNPELAEQWLDDVAAQLQNDPNQRVFNASPGDGWHAGHCVCENCLAWDHPDGEPRRYAWQGLAQEYVPLSDREVRFANRVARGLKERFPEQELYVYMLAYGNSRPAPLGVVPENNVIIGHVANFLFGSDRIDRGSGIDSKHRDQFAEWGKVTELMFWRPNVGSPVGFQWGLPDIPLRRTMDDIKHVAEHGWAGIFIDFVREYWSTQGPLYYLMGQLTWNPHQDGEEILSDYYRRAFGPAAEAMAAYWNYLEALREACYGTEIPGSADHDIIDFYTPERLALAQEKLDQARARAADGPELYLRRIAFVQAGFDFTRIFVDNGRLVREIERGEDPEGEARAQVERNWQELRVIRQEQPIAIRWNYFLDPQGNPNPHRRIGIKLLAP